MTHSKQSTRVYVVVGVNEANNAIETDRLLIETAQAIKSLINRNMNGETQEYMTEKRMDDQSHSVV